MRGPTFVTPLALLVLTACVFSQADRDQNTENELDKKVESVVDDAAQTVCQAFSPDEEVQTDPQLNKRGFFKNLWNGVKKGAMRYVVTTGIRWLLGKRDQELWTNVNSTVPEWRGPSHSQEPTGDGSQKDICEPETQKKIEKLERAIEVLGKMTQIVQSLKKCSEPGTSQ